MVSQNRRHSLKPGTLGDERFAEAVVARPFFIKSIVGQGYSVLWSDADMVWLGNPFSLLPPLGEDSGVSRVRAYSYTATVVYQVIHGCAHCQSVQFILVGICTLSVYFVLRVNGLCCITAILVAH